MAGSFGGVIVSGGGLFLLREPTGRFGGLEWTFAKTAAKSGESPEDTALRAVREKTGYEARIRGRLSGAFNGKSGPATYFLMDASHPPGATNWETKETYWARYDEAVHMIRRSSNTHARQRDLAILDAAKVAVGSLVFSKRMTVHPADWPGLRPMPGMHVTLHPELAFDTRQMKQIGRGFVMHIWTPNGSSILTVTASSSIGAGPGFSFLMQGWFSMTQGARDSAIFGLIGILLNTAAPMMPKIWSFS